MTELATGSAGSGWLAHHRGLAALRAQIAPSGVSNATWQWFGVNEAAASSASATKPVCPAPFFPGLPPSRWPSRLA
jgi:hypothetical protein